MVTKKCIYLYTNSADPRLLGALRGGGGGGALEKQYLFRGSYKLPFFFF